MGRKASKGKASRSGSPGRGGGEAAKRALFLERLARIFSVSLGEAEQIASTPVGRSVRINRLAPRNRDAIEADLIATGAALEPVGWCPDAWHLHSDKAALVDSALFEAGEIYLQNASSFAPSLALEPAPGQRILDLCAAPGGKALHIAALAGGEAALHLNDGIPARVKKLETVLAQFHARPEAITGHPAQYADKFIEGPFDRILIDAQCTGEGMVDLSAPAPLRFWSMERIAKYSRLQQRMIMSAWKLLKPGGVLVYSTCTYAPEEDEAPVSHLLQHRADAMAEPIPLDLPRAQAGLTRWDGRSFHEGVAHARRIRASAQMEGFFLARVRKQA